MNSMVERAWGTYIDELRQHDDRKRALIAALQAALDPGDEALVERIAAHIFENDAAVGSVSSMRRYREHVYWTIAALRAAAQEQKPHD